MAKSGRKAARSGGVKGGSFRWIVGVSAIGMAILAIYVLMNGGGGQSTSDVPRGESPQQPALDDIDAKSREAMRDLLRDAGD